jgi:serine/threonine protein kinase
MIAPASRKLGKYDIQYKLGRGGMADVYLAHDTETKATVALKLIEHANDADTRDSIEAERRGAELQQRLAEIDPRVVRIYSIEDIDHYFCVVMEYIDGQDLAELMRNGHRLEPEFSCDVAVDVLETISHAHNLQVVIEGREFQGIVHGDIKPKNLRIDSHAQTRVLDFGIAKALSMSRRLTRNEFGSVPYASPERLDTGQVNAASDLWSLAVMLYEMVTGLQPYHAEDTERLERMIRSRIPPPPAPDPCPEVLRRILVKALHPEPELRYQTAFDFIADLRAFRHGDKVNAVTEDMDATRRTIRRDEAGDDTRRTTPSGVDRDFPTSRTPAAAAIIQARKKSRTAFYARRVAAGFGLVFMAWFTWTVLASMTLYQRGQKFARAIASDQITDPNQIWKQWTELSDGSSSSVMLHGPAKLVKQRLVGAADHVIVSYRDGTNVSDGRWKEAHDYLAHALTVDPDDATRGELRLTEGHVEYGAHQYSDALEKFEEAARLLPHSADPQLGLARVYIYGLGNIESGDQALQEAEHRDPNFRLGKREKALLADGYRGRGDRMVKDLSNVQGLPAEKDELQRARDDYKRSLELYQEAAPCCSANKWIPRVQKNLDDINQHLQSLDNPVVPGSSDETFRRNLILSILRRLKIWR